MIANWQIAAILPQLQRHPSHPKLSYLSMTHTQLLILQDPFIDTALHTHVFTVPLLFRYTNVHCVITAYRIPYSNVMQPCNLEATDHSMQLKHTVP